MERFPFGFLVLGICIASQSIESSAEDRGQMSFRIFAGTGDPVTNSVAYQSGQPSDVADQLPIGNPFGIEFSGDQVWITSVDDQCIYHGTTDGKQLSRVAGNGLLGYSGDGGSALEARFNWPHEVRVDKKGNLFVADTRNHAIRRIDGATGIVTTIAGNGEPGFAGDGETGKRIQLKQPHSVALDGRGGLLVADTVNHRLRRIDLDSGIIETIAGTGQRKLPRDGADAKSSPLFGPRAIAVDEDSIWIALREGNSIWRLDRNTQTLHHIAGTGEKGYSGDGGPPKDATFRGPKGLVIDEQGRLLVVDTENHAVRRIDLKSNRVDTVLGGTLADETFPLKRPHGIAVKDGFGFLVADSEFHRVLHGR